MAIFSKVHVVNLRLHRLANWGETRGVQCAPTQTSSHGIQVVAHGLALWRHAPLRFRGLARRTVDGIEWGVRLAQVYGETQDFSAASFAE
jgi:hypothetical protein